MKNQWMLINSNSTSLFFPPIFSPYDKIKLIVDPFKMPQKPHLHFAWQQQDLCYAFNHFPEWKEKTKSKKININFSIGWCGCCGCCLAMAYAAREFMIIFFLWSRLCLSFETIVQKINRPKNKDKLSSVVKSNFFFFFCLWYKMNHKR